MATELSSFNEVLRECYEPLWEQMEIESLCSPILGGTMTYDEAVAHVKEQKRLYREIGPEHGPWTWESGGPYRRGKVLVPYGIPGRYRSARGS